MTTQEIEVEMSELLTGEDIRASYVPQTNGGMRGDVLRFLGRHGPSPTRDIKQYVGGKAKPGGLTEVLARLVEAGEIVASKKPTTARGGRPGVVYRIA